MAYNRKQRVVGVLVLIAVVSVLFPVIFNGGGRFQAELKSRIPAAPLIKILPESSQTRPVIIADSEIDALRADAISEIQETDNSGNVEDALEEVEQTPSLGQSGLPDGWSIRLGSFAKEENAFNLIQRLQASDYKAYTRKFSNSSGELISVLVGPGIDRNVAEDYLEELENQFRLAGDIVPYDINNL